jgi:hypothetical protein
VFLGVRIGLEQKWNIRTIGKARLLWVGVPIV